MFSLSKKKEAGFSDSDSESVEITETPSFQRNDILVCATYGKVYAVHKRNGSRLWRAQFGAAGGVVSLFITDYDRVIAAGNGKTTCLDLYTGHQLWINKMKGCGYEEVGTISTPSRILDPQSTRQSSDQDDALPEYQEETRPNSGKPVIVACTNGKCMGLDADSGEELWRFKCPKGGYKIPTALVDPSTEYHRQHNVYVGCGKMIYCLDAQGGDLKWSTKISNAKMGQGYMTLATPWSSRLAAEAHTAFNQFPSAQQESLARQQRAANSGG
ncbi:hypothetical protein RO3G_05596 [Lichtheimia corymbifera JMRC:FSU:9682]|uniref:Pyrrolo-quinoline quinone repeat domain-containing protein n=1 Tax=Lichtheimia corymbifera JMRC:FSU:9682 TaxID=1263082 RepID=A0A068RGK6_9FUNG|nr:hypothetical protein RO3G_05596 [Lichtheimia corymbifera JMRC:FSU:9682]